MHGHFSISQLYTEKNLCCNKYVFGFMNVQQWKCSTKILVLFYFDNTLVYFVCNIIEDMRI